MKKFPTIFPRVFAAAALVSACLASALPAQEGPPAPGTPEVKPAPPKRFVVGTREVPPFSFREDGGEWTGISIELWRKVAAALKIDDFEIREFDLPGLLAAAESGEIDVAAAALTITLAREEKSDFSHPYHTSGLGIAVTGQPASALRRLFDALFNFDFLELLAGLLVATLAAGALAWAFEHHGNQEQFGTTFRQGLGEAFWWAAVTLTTVGYGDKAPKTFGGRAVALVWMLTGVVMISGFTAAVATSLTIEGLRSRVRGPEDLSAVKTAVVKGSTGEAWLRARSIRPTLTFPEAPEALRALAAGRVQAVVYDAPALRFQCTREEFAGRVRVLPKTFERQDYGFMLPQGSPLREPINRAVLREIATEEWKDLLLSYLGE